MQDAEKREIIIIRRRSDEQDDSHHGGVWKIAYADFMTAMMAFFLVMWLVSATNNHAKKAIAHYFNPIKLVDATDARKGISDPRSSSEGLEPGAVDTTGTDPTDGPTSPTGHIPADKRAQDDKSSPASEAKLFQDPFAVLSDLAKNASKEALHPDFAPDISDKISSGQNGLTGGNEFRDPFDPVYWKGARTGSAARPNGAGTQPIDEVATPDAGRLSVAAEKDQKGPAETDSHTVEAAPTPTIPNSGGAVAPQKPVPPSAKSAVQDRTNPQSRAEATTEKAAPQVAVIVSSRPDPKAGPDPNEGHVESVTNQADPSGSAAVAQQQKDAMEAQAQSLVRQIGATLGAPGATKPQLDVVVQKDGVLISLMDKPTEAMFAIGSAEPKPDLVVEMTRIGAILAREKGQVVVSGHTDGRPFHNASYDNWRLSSARAQMAYYMLVHGGLQEGRVVRVEGHADHQPKVSGDPLAAANRRIDILLRQETVQ